MLRCRGSVQSKITDNVKMWQEQKEEAHDAQSSVTLMLLHVTQSICFV